MTTDKDSITNIPAETNPGAPDIGVKLAHIDAAVKGAIEDLDPSDPVAAVMLDAWISDLSRMSREWTKQFKSKQLDLLYAIGDGEKPGDIQFGSKRWYVGTTKKVKAKDDARVLETLLDETGGDMSLICSQYMSSNAWKQGAVKALIGDERHAELFETTIEEDPKTGKPKQSVKCIDEDLMKALGRNK